jgi:hypothetical protein
MTHRTLIFLILGAVAVLLMLVMGYCGIPMLLEWHYEHP